MASILFSNENLCSVVHTTRPRLAFAYSLKKTLFLKEKHSPALMLAGIPGQVGGGIVMNAGVSESLLPREFGEIVEEVLVLRPTGELDRISGKDLSWGYRSCDGRQPGILLEAHLKWRGARDPKILEKVREANRIRAQRQPLDLPSCGSVFTNPPGQSAGKLIEACGLKGMSVGQAQVSLKHANFKVNLGGATAKDTAELILQVSKRVSEQFGLRLQTEVRSLGQIGRRMIYTTNAVEALHRQFRKVTKTKGAFTTDEALKKMLYLATLDLRGALRSKRDWPMILGQLKVVFGERISQRVN